MRQKQLIIVLILLSILSCNNDSLQTKQGTEIINDILLQIVSEDFFFPVTPPPPADKSERLSKFKTDSAEDYYNKNYRKLIEKLDTNRFVISIEDSTDIYFNKSFIDERLKEKGYNDLIFADKALKTKLAIDFDNIKNTGKFELIKRSKQFPKGFNFRKYKGFDLTYYYFGNMTFSQPFLNKSHDYGYIIYKRECGFECDQDDILIIKKQNNKWIITDKIYAR